VKRNFKQRWSTIPALSPLILTHSTEKGGTTIYDVRNPDPGLGQAQKCGRV
jgi:hypothetical protein